jgi:hypothetical protein
LAGFLRTGKVERSCESGATGTPSLDDLRDRDVHERLRIGVERLDLDLEAGVGGRDHAVAGGLVAGVAEPTSACSRSASVG